MTIARRSPVSFFLLATLLVAGFPELAWSMPKTSRDMACRVVSVDIPRRMLVVEREDGTERAVFEILWTDRTIAFADSDESSPEALAVGERIHVSYVKPLFLHRRIARRLLWETPMARREEADLPTSSRL